jgi:hypothetical protein
MSIELKDKQTVARREEVHYKIVINGKEVWISKWQEYDEYGADGDTDIFKGIETLSEEEQEEVIDFVNEEA